MANHAGPVPSWLNTPYVEKMLSESLKLPSLKIKSLDITPGSNVGDNYACQVLRISTVYISNGPETKLSLIAKCTVSTRLMETIGGGDAFFEVEAAFYTKFAPKIHEITGNEDRIEPKVYFIDHEKQTIFMEDITARDFKLHARNSFLSIEQCYLTIDAIATLHGTSYYLIKDKPDLKETFKKAFWSSEKNSTLTTWFRNTENAIKEHVGKYGLPDALQKKLFGVFETLRRDNLKICDLQPDKLNLLQHGDCWKSNMMFHFNDKTPDAVKLLDFQIVNFNCFANDLQHFLFSSVETQALVDNMDNILQRYYRKLVEVAPDIPGVSFERIKKEFEERYFFGLVLSIIFRPIFYLKVAPDPDASLDGTQDMGYSDQRYIDSLKVFLEFFEKAGVI